MHRKVTVYFHQRPDHREIQKDTVRYAPRNITALSPIRETTDWIIAHQTKPENLAGVLGKALARNLVPHLPLLNIRKIPEMHKKADFVYTWNCIPLNSKKPFIIELENAYAVAFYNSTVFKMYRPLIKKILLSSRCHKVVCMSEACRLSLISELGEELEKKIVVLPPFVKNHLNETVGEKSTIDFLFVGLGFELKGGRELLKAFHELEEPKARLTIVGFQDKKYIDMYKDDKRIKFLGRFASRNSIFTEVYPKSDILVLPSLNESYGVATLEAMSFGLGLITTNVYAFPEMVIDGFNGALLNHPFLKPVCYKGHCFVDITKWTIPQFQKRFLEKTELWPSLCSQIKGALEKAVRDHRKWKENSRKLFLNKFSEEKWRETFQRVFE